ncbi:hypothetical protein [Flavobacterium cyanobacteriorum]|nr:hypothetical protein [Flavobacterium cyanobacteriorum]
MSRDFDIFYIAWWITALLFIVPFFIVGIRKNLYRAFSYHILAATFSKIAVVYGAMCIVALVLLAGSYALADSVVWYREVLIGGGYMFIMAFYLFILSTIVFFYPALLILTVLYYVSGKWRDSR